MHLERVEVGEGVIGGAVEANKATVNDAFTVST
jgi:hypothetical protein